jgi:protein-tyrosine phosphatase
MKRFLCVCLGNICRSPLAEGILRKVAADAGVAIHVESAGTANYHVGSKADRRSIEIGNLNKVDINLHRAQQFQANHFDRFDYILVMDENNERDVLRLARNETDKAKVFFYDPNRNTVEDPYYGDHSDFEKMYRHLEMYAKHWVEK